MRDLRIDPGDIGQSVRIENTKPSIVKLDNPILLQSAQYAIDVDGSKARGISDMFLGQGKLHFLDSVSRPMRPIPHEQFKEKPCNPFPRRLPADACQLIKGDVEVL